MARPDLSLRGRSVLVTGGAGFIGSHVVERLRRERPRRIDVVDNLWLGRRANLRDALRQRSVRLHVFDAGDLRRLRDLCRRAGTQVVFDLATIPLPASLVRPRWAAASTYRLALAVAELARAGEVETLIHCSSSEVYGSAVRRPISQAHPLNVETPYAAVKAAGDLLIRSYWRAYGIDAAIVRPFNTYGPRQNRGDWAGVVPMVMNRIAAGRPPVIHGDGSQTRDLSYVTDVADAIVRTYMFSASRRRVLNVASGREVRIDVLVRTICRIAGAPQDVVHVPARPGDLRRQRGNAADANALLGYRPRVGLREGLRRTVAWYEREAMRLTR